jgi:hypothetical protein
VVVVDIEIDLHPSGFLKLRNRVAGPTNAKTHDPFDLGRHQASVYLFRFHPLPLESTCAAVIVIGIRSRETIRVMARAWYIEATLEVARAPK